MRKNVNLNFILTDHASTMLSTSLGSTSLVTDASGAVISEVKYKAWGETHYSSGTEQTKYTYTGQYSYVGDFGLQYYNARWYDPSLGRFAQADTIIPQSQGVQAWDRYAYTNNNPVLYTDPSGHCIGDSWVWATGSCLTGIVSATIDYIKENPNRTLIQGKSFNLPVVIPKGYGNETTQIINTTISFKSIRTTGRLGDDLIPITLAIGWLLTIAPEQVENYFTGAEWNEYVGDFVVDTGGFATSEMAGDIVGGSLAFLHPVAGLGGNFAGDIAWGLAWENAMETEGYRLSAISWIGELPARARYLSELLSQNNRPDLVRESPHPWQQIIKPSQTPMPQ